MPQVSVTIDNRKYRLACNEGEEARLESLAGMMDGKIGELRAAFGEIGDVDGVKIADHEVDVATERPRVRQARIGGDDDGVGGQAGAKRRRWGITAGEDERGVGADRKFLASSVGETRLARA